MSVAQIETRLVMGFLDAGKTTYIRDCIRNDYFSRCGRTVILCFEQGEEIYEEKELGSRNAAAVYYEGEEEIEDFCLQAIEDYQPDRIYVEMNVMQPELREKLPSCLKVTSAVTWIDWETFPLYFENFQQHFFRMVSGSRQVTFRGCPSKELLAPYSERFRVMNPKASFLREDPMGYHEKAFDLFLPFSLDGPRIELSELDYIPFWLDAREHPEHYEGKLLRFKDPLQLRGGREDGTWQAGRTVMTCCMADLQYMAVDLRRAEPDEQGLGGIGTDTEKGGTDLPGEGWAELTALAQVRKDEFGQKKLTLLPREILSAPAPAVLILDVKKAAM